jgi:hypothetical protein
MQDAEQADGTLFMYQNMQICCEKIIGLKDDDIVLQLSPCTPALETKVLDDIIQETDNFNSIFTGKIHKKPMAVEHGNYIKEERLELDNTCRARTYNLLKKTKSEFETFDKPHFFEVPKYYIDINDQVDFIMAKAICEEMWKKQ